ncbi:MAG: arginyltransferase [Gammaproteobacteria bacterium]|nr:arginyltransferase [Gammaproteobacteria bacterium]
MSQQRIKLYQGSVTECSYLPDRQAINIYADPHHPQPRQVYNQLIKRGFRRSGEYVYRPGCTHCSACIPVRILCDEFQPRRTDRRNRKKNASLSVDFKPARFSDQYFELYRRYLSARHPNGGMDNPEPIDFERFLLNPWGETLFVEIRDDQRLVAVAVTDATSDGLSAVYTFFDPDYSDRALGKFCILEQIELCKSMNFPYLYLGFWVDACQKMQYKIEFMPQEHFDGQTWSRYDGAGSE